MANKQLQHNQLNNNHLHDFFKQFLPKKTAKNLFNCRYFNFSAPSPLSHQKTKNNMTRFDTQSFSSQNKTVIPPAVWVKTSMESGDKYSLTIMEKTRQPQAKIPGASAGCAYAKLSLMESGAVMASFPVMSMASGAIRSMLGVAWFELAAPFQLPAFVFGYDIEIPAGRHPIVFILESWVVLFRPQNTSAIIKPG